MRVTVRVAAPGSTAHTRAPALPRRVASSSSRPGVFPSSKPGDDETGRSRSVGSQLGRRGGAACVEIPRGSGIRSELPTGRRVVVTGCRLAKNLAARVVAPTLGAPSGIGHRGWDRGGKGLDRWRGIEEPAGWAADGLDRWAGDSETMDGLAAQPSGPGPCEPPTGLPTRRRWRSSERRSRSRRRPRRRRPSGTTRAGTAPRAARRAGTRRRPWAACPARRTRWSGST